MLGLEAWPRPRGLSRPKFCDLGLEGHGLGHEGPGLGLEGPRLIIALTSLLFRAVFNEVEVWGFNPGPLPETILFKILMKFF